LLNKIQRKKKCDFGKITGTTIGTRTQRRMRKFYLQYKNSEKHAPVVQEISRAENVVIIESCTLF